jgi:hypothetical protein
MARRVFFSFHYERDIWRANVVRKSWVVAGSREAEFIDASLWEKIVPLGGAGVQVARGSTGEARTAARQVNSSCRFPQLRPAPIYGESPEYVAHGQRVSTSYDKGA